MREFKWDGIVLYWLWIGFIINILCIPRYLISFCFLRVSVITCLLGITLTIIRAYGLSMLLFRKNRSGYYMVAGTMLIGELFMGFGYFSIIGLFVVAFILFVLYYLMKDHWNDMEEANLKQILEMAKEDIHFLVAKVKSRNHKANH